MPTVIRLSMLCIGIMAAPAALAQKQLEFASGATHETNFESTYGWELDYAQSLSQHTYASLDWLNEGHQENDHRDGLAAQLWTHADLLDGQLSLAAGIGPYAYFDTSRDEPHPYFAPYTDGHGLTLLLSADLTWYMSQHWLSYLRANRIEAEGQVTTMFLLGLGYRFDKRSAAASGTTAPEPLDDEVTLSWGRTDLNSFVSESSSAYALEYRHSLSRHADWTLGWLDEGYDGIIRREGVTSQIWLVKPLRDDRLVLGIGAGAYYAVQQADQTFSVMHQRPVSMPADDSHLSGIVSVMVDYRFDSNWFAHFTFNRIVTNYDRDADVILVGAGYRF